MAKTMLTNKGRISDMAVMKNAYQRLTSVINSVVTSYSEYIEGTYQLEFTDLDTDTQDEIVAYFIDYDERDLFSIYENSKADDITSSLLVMLKNSTRESDEDFIECLKVNLRRYYTKRAQEMIDECCIERAVDEAYENGLRRVEDRQTGEVYWSKF